MFSSPLLMSSGVGPFTPAKLFAFGEQGLWYDPSDFSTLFQDTIGTTPVTAVGQSVGLILDKSGKGNNAAQTTSAARPVLQQDANGKYYLQFDGVDDSLITGTFNLSSSYHLTFWAGIQRANTTTGVIAETSVNYGSYNNTFLVLSDTVITAVAHGPAGMFSGYTTGTITPPATTVVSAAFNGRVSGASGGWLPTLRTNAASNRVTPVVSNSPTTFSAFASNQSLFIGSRGNASLRLNFRLYSMIIRGAFSTSTEIGNTETYVNSKTSAY